MKRPTHAQHDRLGLSGWIAAGAAVAVSMFIAVYGWVSFDAYQNVHAQRAEMLALSPDAGFGSAYDLIAQQDMAKWAYSLLLVSIMGLAISLGGVVVVALTLRETRRMTVATRAIGEDQTRAYVDAKSLEIEWSVIPQDIILTVRNSGATPARWFEVHASAIVAPPNAVNTLKIENLRRQGRWTALAGNDAQTVRLEPHDVTDWQGRFLFPQTEHVFVVRGLIRYADVFGSIFETDFVFFAGELSERARKFSKPLTPIRAYVRTADLDDISGAAISMTPGITVATG